MDTATLIKALNELTVDELRQRLAELNSDQRALRTLLRAVLARERAHTKRDKRENEVAER
jgi:hypothetical protein